MNNQMNQAQSETKHLENKHKGGIWEGEMGNNLQEWPTQLRSTMNEEYRPRQGNQDKNGA